MTYRISTGAMHDAAIAQLLSRQSQLSRTQTQIASGKRIQSPADDPVAATRILELERSRSQLVQFGKNADAAVNRLSIGEQAMADLGGLLQRVHQLAVQANNGSMDDTSLSSIATELKTRVQELQDVANRRDTGGEYLFAGYSTQTQPFVRTAAGVAYTGDQGVRTLQISPTQRIVDGFSGAHVFMDVPEGNGTFAVEVGAHTGTASIDTGQVVDSAAWNAAPVPREYTIRFTDPDLDGTADSWEVLDSNGDPLLDASSTPITGTYVPGGAIEFNGVQVKVSGSPAIGDTFGIRPAGRESLFETFDEMILALDSGADTPQSRAQLSTAINQALTQLAQGLDHVINVRAEIGARLSTLDNAETMRADLDFELSGNLSELRDLDYAEAISRMNQELMGLQAAQAAYGRIAQLSLFDYI